VPAGRRASDCSSVRTIVDSEPLVPQRTRVAGSHALLRKRSIDETVVASEDRGDPAGTEDQSKARIQDPATQAFRRLPIEAIIVSEATRAARGLPLH
jgi:hypothetical protein